MKPSALHRLLPGVLSIVLAAPIAAASNDKLAVFPFRQPTCTSEGELSLDGINPTRAVDYVELRKTVEPTDYGGDPLMFDVLANREIRARVTSRSGAACATAQERQSCLSALRVLSVRLDPISLTWSDAQLKAILLHRPWTDRLEKPLWDTAVRAYPLKCADCPEYHAYLVTTRGDNIESIENEAGLRAFLGPIDTLQEAALLVDLTTQHVGCGSTTVGAVRVVEGGYEVIAMHGRPCGRNARRYVIYVGKTGETKMIRDEPLKSDSTHCGKSSVR